jgi:hypothetical protein
MATDPDDLVAWIAELRDRVERGELDGRGTFAVGGGELAVGLAARIMLADLDHDKDLTPEQRRDPFSVERRRLLFADLRRLREQIA